MSSKTAYVAYYRVSTDKQGASGLGLEAQQHAVQAFTRGAGIVATYTEVESGKRSDRPQLALAMAHAKKIGARLLIAKLDRLARNVAFISNMMESGVPFIACDMPNADPFRLHIEAAIAEEEARKISERTRAALSAAKARGVKLGGYRGGNGPSLEQRQEGRVAAARTVSARVASYAATVLPHVTALKDQGLSLNAIAKRLTAAGIATPNGSTTWQHGQVARVLAAA